MTFEEVEEEIKKLHENERVIVKDITYLGGTLWAYDTEPLDYGFIITHFYSEGYHKPSKDSQS